MVKSAFLRLAVITAALLCAFAFAFASCGRSKHPAGSGGFPTADSALAEVDALACPEGVDVALWGQLRNALKEALNKTASTPPTGNSNQVDDLAIADNGDGTFTLTWHYRNLGDYDQDGRVALEDIYPLAQHFGESVPESDAERNSIQAVIDGSGSGKVDIADITPIAQHYQTTVQRYAIEGAEAQNGPWSAVGEVAQDTGSGDGRLEYAETIQSPAALWHRVVPYDAEGNPGEPSNAVLRPSNEPVIYEVTPTSGYQHEECTFTATVSGAEPLTYTWDFGGGATPDTSSESSPTVTLADAGEYEATLTVTNAYGSANYPFTLIINERDMWAHTWGGSGTESISSLAVDGTGALWAAGFTTSFGGESEVLLLKFDTTGAVEWARTWGGEGYESACSIKLTASNEACVAGRTTTYGADYDDMLLLKYDTSGDLLWSKTWGTVAYERAVSMATETDGSMYVCGSYLEWGGKDDILLCKFDAEGVIQWAVTWGGDDYDYAKDVAVAAESVYVCGTTGSFGAGNKDALLLKYSRDGELQWARTLGGADSDGAIALSIDDGLVFVSGYSRSFGQGDCDVLVCAVDIDGNLAWQSTWGDGDWQIGEGIAHNDSNEVIVAGSTESFSGGYRDAMLLGLDGEGNLLWSKTWGGENENRAYAVTSNTAGDMYIGGIAPGILGAWVEVEGVVSEAQLELGFPEATHALIAGSQSTPEGTQAVVDGIIDTGGGDDDALVLKNYPR